MNKIHKKIVIEYPEFDSTTLCNPANPASRYPLTDKTGHCGNVPVNGSSREQQYIPGTSGAFWPVPH
jgi:hypothetical protein